LLPYIALGTATVVLGFSPIFVRLAAAPGPVTSFFRLGFAGLFLTPVVLFQRRKTGLPSRSVILVPLLGGLFTALDHATWSTAVNMTTATNAILLNYVAPIWVALFGFLFLRERHRWTFWIGLAITMLGALGVLGADFVQHPTLGRGDLLALISSLFYAGYFLATQTGRQSLDTLTYVWIACLVGSFTSLLISLGLGFPLSGYSGQTYLTFVTMALVSQIGGYMSTGYALGHIPASVVSPTMIGQPVLTALLAFFILGERLFPAQIAAGLAVLLGIYLVHMGQEHPEQVMIPE
jgi:drug/metabolite transporter (DMT)-like permease